MFQMIGYLLAMPGDRTEMWLLSINRYEHDILMRKELESLSALHPGAAAIWVCVCVCVRTYIYLCVFMYISPPQPGTTAIYTHTYAYMYVCMYLSIYLCIYICMYLCMYIRIFVYVYTYMCIYYVLIFPPTHPAYVFFPCKHMKKNHFFIFREGHTKGGHLVTPLIFFPHVNS